MNTIKHGETMNIITLTYRQVSSGWADETSSFPSVWNAFHMLYIKMVSLQYVFSHEQQLCGML